MAENAHFYIVAIAAMRIQIEMALVAIRYLGDVAPGLDGRTVNRKIRHLIVAAILHLQSRNRPGQESLRAPAFHAIAKDPRAPSGMAWLKV